MFSRRLLLAVLALLIGAGPALAQQPEKKKGQEPRVRDSYRRALPRDLLMPARSALAVVGESEPNDSPAEADAVALGDQGTGEVNPAGDADYWIFSVPAQTILDIDVDASQVGSPLDPTLELLDVDGMTSLAFNDDFDGLDSRIQFPIEVAGDYFIVIRAFAAGGGPGQTYTINFNTATPGPGDPTTEFAAGFGGPAAMAFDDVGNLFVAELGADQVSRVTPDGTASVFATGIASPLGLAFDGFGDLLVASGDDATVYKISSVGDVTPFITGLTFPWWATTGPDGSIWVSDPGDATILRYDAFGTFQESFDVAGADGGAFFMAFSPAGELHFVNAPFDAIYKLAGGQPVLVFAGQPFVEGFAFDSDGNLYVASENRGRATLYAADGTVLEDPFALSLVAPGAVAFGRDPDGTTNARLFASDFGTNSVRELNPNGIQAPGWPVAVSLLFIEPLALPDGVVGADFSVTLTVTEPTATPAWGIVSGELPPGLSLDANTGVLDGFPTGGGTFDFRVRAETADRFGERDYSIRVTSPSLVVGDVADQLLGATGLLSPEEERFLDLAGNNNGMFDVGDFRAFLEARGQLDIAAVLAERAKAGDSGTQRRKP